jgi:hypothetical protein
MGRKPGVDRTPEEKRPIDSEHAKFALSCNFSAVREAGESFHVTIMGATS